MLAIEKAFGPIDLGHKDPNLETPSLTDENQSLWTVFLNQVSPNRTSAEF
jgi:hypothetical protein